MPLITFIASGNGNPWGRRWERGCYTWCVFFVFLFFFTSACSMCFAKNSLSSIDEWWLWMNTAFIIILPTDVWEEFLYPFPLEIKGQMWTSYIHSLMYSSFHSFIQWIFLDIFSVTGPLLGTGDTAYKHGRYSLTALAFWWIDYKQENDQVGLCRG